MTPFFKKRLPRGRPKRGRRDDKVLEIAKAGTHLLAQRDFEAWSMARLARDAGCSVGTLYSRFPDKHACLHFLINATFRSMLSAATTELSTTRWGPLAPSAKVDLLVNHVVSFMTHPNAAGVIRATIKLATVRPDAIEEFENYRKAIAGHAVSMLGNDIKVKASAETIRVAVQMMLATVTDAVLLQKPGVMTAGSGRMKSALSNMVRGYIGLTKKDKWSGTEADDPKKPVDNEVFDEPPASIDARYDPEVGAFRRAKSGKSANAAKSKSAPAKSPSVVVSPPRVPKSPTPHPPPLPRKRRRLI